MYRRTGLIIFNFPATFFFFFFFSGAEGELNWKALAGNLFWNTPKRKEIYGCFIISKVVQQYKAVLIFQRSQRNLINNGLIAVGRDLKAHPVTRFYQPRLPKSHPALGAARDEAATASWGSLSSSLIG